MTIATQTASRPGRAFILMRNLLIFFGAVAGALLGVWRFQSDAPPPAVSPAKPDTGKAMPLVALPAAKGRLLRLNNPASLDSPFGRELLTGMPATDRPNEPLTALPIDRSHDFAKPTLPAVPAGELPAASAPDEVRDRDQISAPVFKAADMADLPAAARKLAEEATKMLEEVSRIQRSAPPNDPAYFGNQAKAAELLRPARDKLYEALEIAPEAAVLVELMQQVKLALYTANKTGRR